MSSKWKKWCPNGCGKCATRYMEGKINYYECDRCNKKFSVKRIKKYNKGGDVTK